MRFSTPEQAKGDTIRRQLAASEAWAMEHGVAIDRRLKDPGLSGYTGANVSPTADLGRLLDLVRSGQVPAGSVLLVENLDRLSRQDILPALRIFTTLIENGIKVVTLADGREYDAKSVTANPMDLMYSIMVLSRGNEESRIKSQRVMASWRAKQARAATSPVTSQCPQWLRREDGRWVFVPEAVAAIRLAAKMILNGYTWKAIVRQLNETHPKTFGRKRVWTRSNLFSLMVKRTMIGEYQPAKRPGRKGNPIPIGDPVPDYYPAVLDDKTFRQVQLTIKQRANGGGWRDNETVNIWSSRMFDVAENKIYMSDHGSGQRYKSVGRLNGTSDMPMSPLYEVDRGLVFGLLNYLRMNEIQPSASPEPLHKELSQIESRLEKLSASLEDMATDPAVVVAAIDKLQGRKAELLDLVVKAESLVDGPKVTSALRAWGDIENPETRRKLKVAIASVVEMVHVHFIREYRDHVVSAVFQLVDRSEVDWCFRINYLATGRYALEWLVAEPA